MLCACAVVISIIGVSFALLEAFKNLALGLLEPCLGLGWG